MDDRLDGWHEIAAQFRKNVRTVQRWKNERGMPVHHLPGKGPKSPVYAFRSELLKWASADGLQSVSGHEDISERLLERINDLSQAKNLYRRDFVVRFVLQKSDRGVRAQIEIRYDIVNGSHRRQPYTQEVTIDDCEFGHVELLSVSADGKPITLLKRPLPTKRFVGYVSYQAPTLMIDPSSSGKRYTGLARWIINRNEIDLWYLHTGILTLGVTLQTIAPPEFDITPSYSSVDLLTVGQHIDIAWKRRRL